MSAHAQGVLYVHSAPPALCPHIEWAVAGIMGAPVSLPWSGQPAAPGALRAELTWQAQPGTAGAIASALAGWNRLRFEVTEDSSPGCDGVRHCYTPDLGLFTAVTGANDGASGVALSYEDADKVGLRPHMLDYDTPINTANGIVKAARVNKMDPDPPRWTELKGSTHPSIRERLEAIDAQAGP